MMGISVIIPVYNAKATLYELYKQLKNCLENITTNFEIIMVEDCSKDKSWDIIMELSQMDKRIKGIQLYRNYGQHNALLCGIREACYEIIVTMDDDLQNPPQEIPRLLDKLAEGYDVVYGAPQQEKHGVFRDIASRFTKYALKKSMSVEIARNVSAFRVFRSQIREAFADYQSSFVSIDVLLTWGTTRYTAIPVHQESRHTGVSNYSFRMLAVHAMNMITGFSILPLQLASIIGFGFTCFGLCVLTYVIGRYLLQGESVPGFPFLASIIAIFSGAQLFALGLIGEYLARMHYRVMGKPPYLVRKTSGKEKTAD
jgi:glycosyltransferase involved in cell wall biosynthesis